MDGLAVRSVAYFMEERSVAFEWQYGDVLPGHVRATSPCACNVTWAATPHFSGAVSVHFGLLLRGLNSVAKAVAVMGGGTEQAVAVFSDCKDVLKSVLNQCAALHIVVA